MLPTSNPTRLVATVHVARALVGERDRASALAPVAAVMA